MSLVDKALKRMKTEEQQRREAAIDAELNFLEARPSMKLMPERSDEILQANYRKLTPEKVATQGKNAELPLHVAEQMRYEPVGNQQPPSPGGGNYMNPNLKPQRSSLFDRAEMRLREEQQAKTARETEKGRSAERTPTGRDEKNHERDDRD